MAYDPEHGYDSTQDDPEDENVVARRELKQEDAYEETKREKETRNG